MAIPDTIWDHTLATPRVCGPSPSSATAPATPKTICVTMPVPRSAIMAPTASGRATPRAWTSEARATSPPTCATGKRPLTDSPIQRSRRSVENPGRPTGGSRSFHPSVLSASVTNR